MYVITAERARKIREEKKGIKFSLGRMRNETTLGNQ